MKSFFSEIEEKILEFWEKENIFKKTIVRRKGSKKFIFFEGPPYANGMPGVHHLLARAFKDIILRYKTMRGFLVQRKAGWDTHGLPTEVAAEKALKIKSKKDIEKIGIDKFITECKKNIFSYEQEWEKFTKRIGYWIDLKDAYITCDNKYIETLWWIIKKFWEKGYFYKSKRVVPWCPRCMTSLSSHEVAQGYKKVKENSIYIKVKLKNPEKAGLPENSYLLVWTTTPWTLPGNLAIAVNPDISYSVVEKDGAFILLASQRVEPVFKGLGYKVLKELKGEELVSLNYERIYLNKVSKSSEENLFKVLAADFVSSEEGSGFVHIAPAFGEDDFNLVKSQRVIDENDIYITVSEEGKMKEGIIGEGKFVKEADLDIIQDLKARDILFKEELYEHDYPFCWRCHSPLLYYLHSSWFVAVSKIKDELIANNEKINWVPSYLKHGRFGNWLESVKDWNFSRERYWGAPIPVWECEKCGQTEVIGSLEELKSKKFSDNEFIVMRHGEAETNTKGILCSSEDKYPLTPKGRKSVKKAAEKLKTLGIDLIYASPVLRTKETAEIVGDVLGIKPIYADELKEISFGEFEEHPIKDYFKFFESDGDRFKKAPKGGENWIGVKRRVYNFVKRIDKEQKNKKILLITHKAPAVLLFAASEGIRDVDVLKIGNKFSLGKAKIRKLEFKHLPYNEEGELDFHRPYIDEIEFICPKCGAKMRRVKQVCDVWFDSGSMPFGQLHYPFENKAMIDKGKFFPADFICEGVDQTRGWFYTLLTVSTLLGFGAPYKNVISLGLVLDEQGLKMSKSRGNIVEPFYLADKYGVDAVRWYFYTVNQPGDFKQFSERGVQDVLRKFLMTYWNCFTFLKSYAPTKRGFSVFALRNLNVLDKWILSKTNRLLGNVTQYLDNFDIVAAAREIDNFTVNDLSLWYIRRSRERFQNPKNKDEIKTAYYVLGTVMLNLAKITAPFVPFLSEKIYQELAIGSEQSVHLENWPASNKKFINPELEEKMDDLRGIVAKALALRVKAGIKIRQPLGALKIKDEEILFGKPKNKNKNGLSKKEKQEFLEIIKGEVNVKKVVFDDKIKEEIELDQVLTKELKEEGDFREIIRAIQDLRKKKKMTPKDIITIEYSGPLGIQEVVNKYKKEILAKVRAKDIRLSSAGSNFAEEKSVGTNNGDFLVSINLVEKR